MEILPYWNICMFSMKGRIPVSNSYLQQLLHMFSYILILIASFYIYFFFRFSFICWA